MNLKLLIKKLIYREKADFESYVKYLKSKGISWRWDNVFLS